MTILKIKKRSGQIVDFDASRISTAIQKAFEATNTPVNGPLCETITGEVLSQLESSYDSVETFPSVEEIQDIVERKLVEDGYFDIAKSYILYRADRARLRAEARLVQLQKLEKNLLKVEKSDGTKEVFSLARIQEVIEKAAEGLPGVESALIVQEIKKNIFDGITTKDINRALVMVAKSYIEVDPDYSFFTARILLHTVYREVFEEKYTAENLKKIYGESLKRNLQKGVDAGRINPELLTFDLKKITAALEPEKDLFLTYLGLQTLYDRYFIHVEDVRIEAPQHFWMRVAMGLALGEDAGNREERAIEFYKKLSSLQFVSSTPTLFNAGSTHPQLSSCYLSTVEDSLSHIFKVISDNAQLSKWAGGIGNDWTRVRATGARIKGTNGRSQGVVPFLKIANDTAVAVNQGGKRKGAVCAYLECWHADFPEFLELRKNTGDERRRTHDMNTAAWIPDLFMKRVEKGDTWTLFSPDEVPELHELYGRAFEEKYEAYEQMARDGKIRVHKKMPAADLWRKMVTMLFETGHPWMTFKDPCNVRSPQDHVGVVHDSNLCTEITLNNSADETAVCNLGSINLAEHFDEKAGDVDWKSLEKTVQTAMRMLDNVIDINLYPTKETNNANNRHRPVGLGVMGFADLLYRLRMDFDSEVAVELSDKVMEFITYHAIFASTELAKERGAYESFKGSKWDRGILPLDTMGLLEAERGQPIAVDRIERMDWNALRDAIKKHGMRNSNCLAIAPTATISNISGCIPCIEPIYKNLYVKSNMGGEFTIVNKYLIQELKEAGLWSKEMLQRLKQHDGSVQQMNDLPVTIRGRYKEVFEIDGKWIIRHAAVRAKWLDQSQSVNIFYRGTSGKDVSDLYKYAWKMGLKTTYYLRTLGASQVEKSTVGSEGTHKRSAAPTLADSAKEMQTMTPEQKNAAICSLLNGPECEACQ